MYYSATFANCIRLAKIADLKHMLAHISLYSKYSLCISKSTMQFIYVYILFCKHRKTILDNNRDN